MTAPPKDSPKRTWRASDYDRPNRLRELREAAQLSQEDVARHFRTSQATIARHEAGVVALDEFRVRAYADLYGVAPVDIFSDAVETVTTEDGDVIRVPRPGA